MTRPALYIAFSLAAGILGGPLVANHLHHALLACFIAAPIILAIAFGLRRRGEHEGAALRAFSRAGGMAAAAGGSSSHSRTAGRSGQPRIADATHRVQPVGRQASHCAWRGALPR